MSEVIATPPATPVWRLSVTQYHAMIDAGILTDDDPVELLDGLLVPKMPKKPLHRATTRLVRQALEAAIPAGWYVDSQEPITLEDSEPEPDVMVVRGDTRDYLDRHPGPSDLALVVEIADATLQRDRELKQHLYARAGIPVYWLIDLPARRIEVNGAPQAGEYHGMLPRCESASIVSSPPGLSRGRRYHVETEVCVSCAGRAAGVRGPSVGRP